jgi:hypothetical protein
MNSQFHVRGWHTWSAALCAAAVLVALPAWAQSASRILSIEEHWSLKIGEPEPDRSSPQTSMVMSPTGDLDGPYFLFTLNHRTVPQYEPGGMQVQLWDGDAAVDEQVGAAEGPLSVPNEEIRWVQRLEIDGGALKFQVLNGTSQTWGPFGGNGVLKLAVPTTLTELNSYRPAVSLSESEVGYAGNRVVSLSLDKLVWRTEDGQVHELNAPIDIDTDIDP